MDLAAGHVAALAWMDGRTGVEVFNLGTGRGTSVLEIIRAFSAACGRELPYVIEPRRAGDVTAIWADPTLANKELGWKAERSVEETLAAAWAWEKRLAGK
jgi:UDP-glucose 4-epimerase